MPVYLVHGFRWPRPLIRIHIILQNLDDAAAEWLVAPGTTQTLLENFYELHPDCMKHLPSLRFVEQYDPDDLSPGVGSQPYSYVADVCEEIKLSADVDDIRGKGLGNEQWAAIMELRDKLAPEEKVGWYIVVCGDEERLAPPAIENLQVEDQYEVSPERFSQAESDRTSVPSTNGKFQSPISMQGSQPQQPAQQQPRGLKKLFGSGRLGRRKSRPNLNEMNSDSPTSPTAPAVPPLPGQGRQA